MRKEKGEQLAGKMLPGPGYLCQSCRAKELSPAQARHSAGTAGDRVPLWLCQPGGRDSISPSAESTVTPRASPHNLEFIPSDPKALFQRQLFCPPPLLLPPCPVGVRSMHPHPLHPPPYWVAAATHPGTARQSSTPLSVGSSG